MASEVRMAADPYEREYRADLGTFALAYVFGFLFLCLLVISAARDDRSAVDVLVPGLLVGALVLYVGCEIWRRTFVSRDRIVKRGVFRTVAIPWQGIQGIEFLPGARTYVATYDHRGREIVLPHLNGSEVDAEKEVRVLRETWEKRRGPHWKPVPEIAAKISLRE
ncbi:PH domain-containing protein [Actinomadura sp. 6N118]|uniref:PH domain-containing protein n=1 Tax=Actinomadura sp. 6N118 TaxID=3375151 RepID=UPI00378F864C